MKRKHALGAVVVLMLGGCTGHSDSSAARNETTSTAASPEATTTTTAPLRCPTADELTGRAKKEPRTVTVTAAETLGFDLRLDPPPADTQPRHTAGEAYRMARAKRPGDPGPDPTIALGLYSDGAAHLNPDGSETKTILHRLAWVVVSRDAVVANGIGGPPTPPRTLPLPPACTLGTTITPVDARTGAVLPIHEQGNAVR